MNLKEGHSETVVSGSPELQLWKVGRFRSIPATGQHLGGGPGVGGMHVRLTPASDQL